MKRTRTCVIALAAGGLSGDGEQGVYTHRLEDHYVI